MTDLRTAAQQALWACKLIVSAFDALKPASAARNEPLQINAARASITALEAALAEPEQEPVAQRGAMFRTHPVVELQRSVESAVRPACGVDPAAKAEPVQEPVLQALTEADRIMGHDDESTEWRERWAHLFSCALTNGGYQCSCGANQRNAK